MENIAKLTNALSHTEPAVVVAVVAIVALLVIAKVVSHLTRSNKD